MTSLGTPETRFARSGDIDIAYQVVGEGERDVVVGIGWVSHLELLWELPETVHFLRRLQSFGRLVLHDARGTGLSDRPARPATIDDLVADLVAVLDAVGSTRAVIVGWIDKAAGALALAARHPHRVEALVLGEAMATTVPRDGHPEGLDATVVEDLAAAVEQGAWGTGALLPGIAPSVADDPRITAWWRRWERMSATPNMAASMLRTLLDLDVRALLAAVTAPALVLHRVDNTLVPTSAVRRLVDDLPNGLLVELPGADLAAFFGDTDALLDEVEEFLTGTRTGADADRAVLTMLVTDVVGSTSLAAGLGDRRWTELLDFHHKEVRAALARHGGTEIDTAGDGFLAVFDLPSRALACAREARDRLAAGGLSIRAGLHTGEVVRSGTGVRGLGVHLAARRGERRSGRDPRLGHGRGPGRGDGDEAHGGRGQRARGGAGPLAPGPARAAGGCMRVAHTATTISWIPSESVQGWLEAGFRTGLAHYDQPPSDVLAGPEEVRRLRDDDRFRFANVLSGWAEFADDGTPTAWGYDDDAGLVMGSTRVRVGAVGATFAGVALPTLRPDPAVVAGSVRLVQTVGGGTGVPLPRPVPHLPLVRWQAPYVWTTLALTLHSDGRGEVELAGASPFPRHWVFGTDGHLTAKSGLTDLDRWLSDAFGRRTPWGDQGSRVVVAAVESAAERALAGQIMRPGRHPAVQRLPAGTVITRQGEVGDTVYLVLDGICSVDVDGRTLGEVGPGAVVGERAVLEGGRRTATLTARTPVRLATATVEDLDQDRLAEVAAGHRREES